MRARAHATGDGRTSKPAYARALRTLITQWTQRHMTTLSAGFLDFPVQQTPTQGPAQNQWYRRSDIGSDINNDKARQSEKGTSYFRNENPIRTGLLSHALEISTRQPEIAKSWK